MESNKVETKQLEVDGFGDLVEPEELDTKEPEFGGLKQDSFMVTKDSDDPFDQVLGLYHEGPKKEEVKTEKEDKPTTIVPEKKKKKKPKKKQEYKYQDEDYLYDDSYDKYYD